MSKYWFDNLPTGYKWHSLWYDYIICFNCGGIRKAEGLCPVCKSELPRYRKIKIKSESGKEYKIHSNSLMGAEGRYEDYIYLDMLESEWRRPVYELELFTSISEGKRPSARAIMVLVFWTYFETRIERLIDSSMKDLPGSIHLNLLKRYQTISSRTTELYKILFGLSNTYYSDLEALGYKRISNLLERIQKARNQFMHGEPEAIDDALIEDLVCLLKAEHESWIAVFNMRKEIGKS
jgi:hypothetical protein